MTLHRHMVPGRIRGLRSTTHRTMREFASLWTETPDNHLVFNLEYGNSASDKVLDRIQRECGLSKEWILGADVPMLINPPKPKQIEVLRKTLEEVGVVPDELFGKDRRTINKALFRLQTVLM